MIELSIVRKINDAVLDIVAASKSSVLIISQFALRLARWLSSHCKSCGISILCDDKQLYQLTSKESHRQILVASPVAARRQWLAESAAIAQFRQVIAIGSGAMDLISLSAVSSRIIELNVLLYPWQKALARALASFLKAKLIEEPIAQNSRVWTLSFGAEEAELTRSGSMINEELCLLLAARGRKKHDGIFKLEDEALRTALGSGAQLICVETAADAELIARKLAEVTSPSAQFTKNPYLAALAKHSERTATLLSRGVALWHASLSQREKEVFEMAASQCLVQTTVVAFSHENNFFLPPHEICVLAPHTPSFATKVAALAHSHTLLLLPPQWSPEHSIRVLEDQDTLPGNASTTSNELILTLVLRSISASTMSLEETIATVSKIFFSIHNNQSENDIQQDPPGLRAYLRRRRARSLDVSARWLQRGRVCRILASQRWAVIVEHSGNELSLLSEARPTWILQQMQATAVRLTAIRVLLPRDLSRLEAKETVARAVLSALTSETEANKEIMLDRLDGVLPRPICPYCGYDYDDDDIDLQNEEFFENKWSELLRQAQSAYVPVDCRGLQKIGLLTDKGSRLQLTQLGKISIDVLTSTDYCLNALVLIHYFFINTESTCDITITLLATVAATAPFAKERFPTQDPSTMDTALATSARIIFRAMHDSRSYLLSQILFVRAMTLNPVALAAATTFDHGVQAAAESFDLYDGELEAALQRAYVMLASLEQGARELDLMSLEAHFAATRGQLFLTLSSFSAQSSLYLFLSSSPAA